MASHIEETEFYDRTVYLTDLQYACKWGCTKQQMTRWLASWNDADQRFALPNPMRTWRDKEPVQATPEDVGADDLRFAQCAPSLTEAR